MVAQAMEEAVGVGRNAGSGKRNQRAERRGCAFERYFVEQVAIYVDVKGRVILNQVALRTRP